MKKFLVIHLLLLLTVLPGCSNKWDTSHENVSQEFIEENEAILEEYLALLKESPYDFNYTFEVAYRYNQLGQGKQAVKYYEKALEIDPTHRPTLNNLAAIHEEVGNYETASEYMVELYNLDPGNAEAVSDTVRILLKADYHEEAQAALEGYATLVGDSADTETTLFISGLFEQILEYRKENNLDQ